jgi:UDP-glucuronate 4-epimerase
MKILFTGAAGFIGSHTSRALLQKGHSIIGLDNFNDYYSVKQKEQNIHLLRVDFPDRFTIVRGDILEKTLLDNIFQTESFDAVIHLAARAGVRPSIRDPKLYHEVNTIGTLNLFECCKKYSVPKCVFASSSSVYGDSKDVPFSEDQILRPISPYASTKLTNENDAYVYSKLYGISMIGLRFFTVYGPAGRPDMAPFLFTKAILEGSPIMRFGDGTTSRDYTYIDDIVSGIVSAIDYNTPYDIFNLGNSNTVSLNEFIATIERITKKKAIIEQKEMQPGDVPHTFADISKAKNLFGYSPKTSIEEGMKRFLEWYKNTPKLKESLKNVVRQGNKPKKPQVY